MLKRIAKKFEVHVFDRVMAIRYTVKSSKGIVLDQEEVAQMAKLKEITVNFRNRRKLTDADVDAIKNRIPDCRLAAIERSDDQRTLKISLN